MSTIDERDEYLKNPFFQKHLYGDFTPFYITIAICTAIAFALFLLNIICCCCSKHSEYWQDRHTGNRWLVSLWTATPHLQPSLDYSDLEKGYLKKDFPGLKPIEVQTEEFLELQKRESDI